MPDSLHLISTSQEFINWIYNRRGWKTGVIDSNNGLSDPTDELIKSVIEYLDD